MPTWGDIQSELAATVPTQTIPVEGAHPDFDGVRRKYLDNLHKVTKRPAIVYYSNWLNDDGSPQSSMTLDDVHGFMETVRGLEGEDLDLILHLPGGELEAAERIVAYLRAKFAGKIRAFVPLAAMSAGTILALGCDRIVMGAHSQLGPIDPQVPQQAGGIVRYAPALAALRQFDRAREEIAADESALAAWLPILEQYGPSFLAECEADAKRAEALVEEWLKQWMLKGKDKLATSAAEWFADFETHLSHSRGLNREQITQQGIVVDNLEQNQKLQDAVLSVHHAFMHSFAAIGVAKIIENHQGVANFWFRR